MIRGTRIRRFLAPFYATDVPHLSMLNLGCREPEGISALVQRC